MSTRSKKNRRALTKQEEAFPVVPPEFNFYAAFRKSPFPPPAELEKYELLYPGVTKQLFDNYVKQTDHRIELEKMVVEGDNKRANTGQHYSFVITLSFMIMAIVLFMFGKDLAAIGSGIIAMVPIVTSFINSSVKRKEEREAKRIEMGLANKK